VVILVCLVEEGNVLHYVKEMGNCLGVENVLHRVKRRGIVQEGKCPGNMSGGNMSRGNVRIPGSVLELGGECDVSGGSCSGGIFRGGVMSVLLVFLFKMCCHKAS